MDRVHRIGQTKRTTIYRIVVEDTIEERVLEIQDHKRLLVGKAFSEEVQGLRAKGGHIYDIARLLGRA